MTMMEGMRSDLRWVQRRVVAVAQGSLYDGVTACGRAQELLSDGCRLSERDRLRIALVEVKAARARALKASRELLRVQRSLEV
jgi:hypothetical protein